MSNFDLSSFWSDQRSDHEDAVQKSFDTLMPVFEEVLEICETSIKAGGKIMFFGNGGSAADAQHLATELCVCYINDRTPIAGLALTTDSSALTASGNDMGFDEIFARQIAALGKPEDVAIGLTTSGNSANVISALKTATQMGIKTISFTGRDGGEIVAQNLCNAALTIPSQSTARIQEMHITFGHLLCGALEKRLDLV